jgi:uncharacterized delta-60 repeat protein
MEARRLFSAGQIDATFGSGGSLTVDVGGDQDTATQMIPSPGEKVLAFGRSNSIGTLSIARFNADGTLDSTFGTGGKAITSLIAPQSDKPGAVAVDSTGRFAVLYGNNGSGAPNAVAVFKADGTLDTSFSTDGLLQVDGTYLSFEGVGFQSDGKMILAGMGFDLENAPVDQPVNYYDYADPVLVRRYNSNGTIDVGFGIGTGRAAGTTALTAADGLEDIEVMSDGRIVLATHFDQGSVSGSENVIAQEVFRLTASGAFDTTLDGDGSFLVGAIADPAASDLSVAMDMEVLNDGSMLLLSQEGALNLALRKFTISGAAASGFNNELERIGRFPQRVGVAENTGEIFLSDNGSVIRYNSIGSADYTYGVDGVATVPRGATSLVNPDGTVLVGGATFDGVDMQITRLQGGIGAPRRPTLNKRGTLIFRTSNDSEIISIGYRSRDQRIIVRLGDFAQSYAPSKIKRFAIYAMGGDDTVTVGLNVRGVYAEGGAGDDTLIGGQGGDVFLGGIGKDKLWGNDGDDKLLGGEGNDYCLGGAGKDDLFGESGVDTLNGAGGNDRLFGGTGMDYLNGGPGADSAADSEQDSFTDIETLLTL